MDQRSCMEPPVIMSETAIDLKNACKCKKVEHCRDTSFGFKTGRRHPALKGVSLIAVVMVFALLLGCGKKESGKDLDTIKIRLGELENRLTRLETIDQETGGLTSRLDGLEKSMARLDQSEKSLKSELSELHKKIDQITKTGAAIKAKSETPSIAPKKPVSKAEKRFHTVQAGETLYRISKKYGISVEDLRRLNKLGQKSVIIPGQKLLVDSGGGQ